jgi:hypothetical protein
VGREQLDLTQGRHAELDARAGDLDAGDPLLDDAAALGELCDVAVERHVRAFEPHGPDPLWQLCQLACRARCRQAAEVNQRVAAAGDAFVELDQRLLGPGAGRTQLRESVDHLIEVVEVLEADRVAHSLLGEDPTTAALGAEMKQLWVGAIHGDAEAEGEVPFERRGVVRDEVGPAPVGDQ